VRLSAVIAAAMALALALAGGRAEAYPEFQLALGVSQCTACHYSPAGGGLLNDYGRTEAGDTISRGGDGRFLHGLWEPPRWLQLGADLRGAALARGRGGDRELLALPMQADAYLRAGGERLSVTVTAGLRGGARDPQPPLVERIASREHYVMYQRESGTYVRAGRFFPVFGLRSQDHTAYVRRYLGFHTLEEPYGVGAGTYGDTWEAHATAFVPRPIEFLGAGTRARGAAVYAERRLCDQLALAGQARIAVSAHDRRVTAGAIVKQWLPAAGVLVLAELDVQHQAFTNGAGPGRLQLAGYAGASKHVARGVMLGAAVHRWQPDLTLRSSRDALELNAHYFPRAHLELHLLARASAEGGDAGDPGLLALLQLHYYL
jgi:hypothetical protein